MASASSAWLYQDGGLRRVLSASGSAKHFQISFAGSFPATLRLAKHGSSIPLRKVPFQLCIKCENTEKKEEDSYEYVERPPYHSYLDSTSGEMEPASGARASIPGKEYWPEGTASRVRAANAPEPVGVSTGSPSYGKNPGSRRGRQKTSVASPVSSEICVAVGVESVTLDDESGESKDLASEYVVYQTEPQEEELTGYDLEKKSGQPHPFIDPKAKKPIKEPLSSEELWWNWRKPEKQQWSRWQRRRPDSETVFLKAMAETGQVKLYGEHPTLTETSLYRARRHLYKEERLQAEQERLESIGPVAYYSEWVKAWNRDTSREAVQKHYEETGEDENTQLIEMLSHQTDREYRIMMGTDIRIKRDPLAMRMREDQIKQTLRESCPEEIKPAKKLNQYLDNVWGGDPVYPTVNYIQDPDEVIDFRGAEFHEPTPDMLDYLKEHGKIITREELAEILGNEKTKEIEVSDMDEAMAQAVDIGENDDEGDDSEAEGDDEDEKITRNWSVLKTTPQPRNAKSKPKKEKMSLDEAVDDSENLTDFLLDFDDDE